MERFKQALNLMTELEDTLSEMYKLLSEKHADDQELRSFFASLSIDERSHGDMIRYQLTALTDDKSKSFDSSRLELDSITRDIRRTKQLMTAELSEKDLLRQLYQLEGSSGETYAFDATIKGSPELTEFLVSLSKTFFYHQKLIAEFAKKRGIEVS